MAASPMHSIKYVAALCLLLSSSAFASLNDQAVLAGDGLFKARIRESLAATAIAVTTEAVTTAFHYKRAAFAIQVLANLNGANDLTSTFVVSVATDANVISDATSAGTVTLTTTNVDAQQALVTDAHISAAVSGQFNSFFNPAS